MNVQSEVVLQLASGAGSIGSLVLLAPSVRGVAWYRDHGEFTVAITGLKMTMDNFIKIHERNCARVAKSMLREYLARDASLQSPPEKEKLTQAANEAQQYVRLNLSLALGLVEVSCETGVAKHRFVWLLFVTKGLDCPFFRLEESRTDDGRNSNKISLDLASPTVLQVCWSLQQMQQTWAVVNGIIKHAARSPVDAEDNVGAALQSLRVDIVNLWPTW